MEDPALFLKIEECLAANTAVALATVVATKGSTPQKVGAKMIVLPDGKLVGTVGGGCVEGAVKSACLEALHRTKKTELIEASLTDETGLKDGDICGGTMKVLVEPLFP